MDKTIVKGMQVLEALLASTEPLGVSEMARQLGMTKSNIHRYLQTFVVLGYVSAQDGRYAATLKTWQQGAKLIERLDIRRVLRPIMQRLSALTKETCLLGVMGDADVIYVEKAESAHSVRAFSEVGERAPLHCSASGKVFLAYDEDILARVTAGQMQCYTDLTITCGEALKAHVTDIRRRGVSLNHGEWEPAVGGIAAPVWDARHELAAAISLILPLSRFTVANSDQLIAQVRMAASESSRALGASVQYIREQGGLLS